MTKQQREALKLRESNGSQKPAEMVKPAKVEETQKQEEQTAEILENQTLQIANELKQEEKPQEEKPQEAKPEEATDELTKIFTLENTIDVVMQLGKKIRFAQKLHLENDLLKEFMQKHNGDATGHRLEIVDTLNHGYTVLDPSIISACLELIKEKQLKNIADLEAEIKLPL